MFLTYYPVVTKQQEELRKEKLVSVKGLRGKEPIQVCQRGGNVEWGVLRKKTSSALRYKHAFNIDNLF